MAPEALDSIAFWTAALFEFPVPRLIVVLMALLAS
jgi:hypothetical protein